MRIGIFSNHYLPYRSGVSTSVEGFRKGLMAEGHDVTIFAQQWGKTETEKDYGIYRYPSVEAPTKVPYAFPVPYSREIDHEMHEMDFDVIHAQHPYLIGVQGKKWAQKKKIPLIFTWHSLYERYAHYASFLPVSQKAMEKWITNTAMTFAKEADHVIVPTQSIFDILIEKKFPEDQLSIVSSGVDSERFAHPDPVSVRARYNLEEDQKIIVSNSRHTKEKNILFLACSIRRVLDADPRVVFIVGGKGDLTEDVESYFEDAGQTDRVIFAGSIPRDDKKDYFAAADIFVSASTSETQGMSITEAMYMGTPVVAVRSSGVRDIVSDGETGVLVDKNPNDFAYVVRKLLRDDEERARLAMNAKEMADEKYTITACTAKLIAVYEKVIKEYAQKK